MLLEACLNQKAEKAIVSTYHVVMPILITVESS